MSLQSHLLELERRHADLEREIEKAMVSPSTDNLAIANLKRRKLNIKDQITRLRKETLH
ncbi:hypothetical protein C8N35_10618 [Breoghania corrubedonensis]|uniref:DUF465 domain-containing protein n=1 Tax=Breoghania corrubedonensis TaxID=665038 RepID=A0A2T5V7B5_9HYPH|nr:DUF465 domain-containing protein [Breoghania corrubedonensis]PTW59637.1 hypothetical protein C8N35_10618 [Breoghania corrubedonensis]